MSATQTRLQRGAQATDLHSPSAILPSGGSFGAGRPDRAEGNTANARSVMTAGPEVGGYSSSMGLLPGGRLLRQVAG